MGNPQIIFSPGSPAVQRTISFPENIYRIQPAYPGNSIVTMSASNITETQNVAPNVSFSFAIRMLLNSDTTSAAFRLALEQWFEWQREGNPWYWTQDSALTALTTLTVGASAGDTTLTVSSITGLSSGDLCVLRSKAHLEIVKISGAPSGATVTLAQPILFTYSSGARFRHKNYFPGRMQNPSQHPIIERPPLYFDAEFNGVTEDVNSLAA